MSDELKQKTISSMLWNSIQRFGCALLSFVSNVVLARLLTPDDFGCIGMLTIFIAISETFVDGGFGAALIQKKDTSQKDFSTIFIWNLIVSIAFYLITFIFSPLVAKFYDMPSLTTLLRVLGLVIILNGLAVIQTTILTKELKFKQLSKVYLSGTLIGVIVSIICALCGLGVWSLVLKTIVTSLIVSISLWTGDSWKPSIKFSIESFNVLFKFGFLMFASKILTTLFDNLQSLVIGRVYSATKLGYYTQAKKLDEIPSSSLTQIVTQVSFPIFAKIADDISYLKSAFRKNIICINYIIFPLQIMLMLLAKNLIVFLFSDKWIPSTTFFRILCIYGLFVGLNSLNSNIYKAIGKSKIYFNVQFIKQIIGILFLIIGLNWGIIGVASSVAFSGFIWWIISAFVNERLVGYGFIEQLKDVTPSLLLSVVSIVPAYYIQIHIHIHPFIIIILTSLIYLIIYMGLSKFFNKEPYKEYTEILKKLSIKFFH